MSHWLDRRTLWQFTLLWWAFALACCLLGIVASAAWHGGHMSLGPLVGALCFSIVAAVSAVWSRGRARRQR
jgi:uncharacterized membrane protein YfcA